MDLDWRNYPCLSPLSVLGVVFSSTAQGQASIFQAAVRCLRLEGLLKSNTVHYSSSLPPLDSPSLLTPHPSQLQATLQIRCTAAVTLHCHNRNLFPAVGLIGTCILQAGGARLWLQFIDLLCRPVQVSFSGLHLYIYCVCVVLISAAEHTGVSIPIPAAYGQS